MKDRPNSDSPKRHCMVVHAYYPHNETRVEREAHVLRDRGYQVDVICLRDENESPTENLNGIDIYRLAVRRHKGKGALVQLLEYLHFFVLAFWKLSLLHQKRRYRVVQLHNLPDFLVFAGLGAKVAGARLILDLHDLMPEFYAARFHRGLNSWPVRLIRWQESISCRFADHVITVTELWRKSLIERGVPAGKVSVVMNVADQRVFQQSDAPPLVANKSDSLTLLYHGSLTFRYGLDLAIQAVGLVRKDIPKIRLIIHGSGDYYQPLVDLVAELHLKDHVQFSTQMLPCHQLPELIRRADIAVVPNRNDVFTDGILPTKLMEYAAVGIPAIASRTSAIQAYFDENMVEYFKPGDYSDLARHILELWGNRDRRRQLAINIREFNKKCSWQSVSTKFEELVRCLQ
jgi:glycosyltransferase involved in cell wall biosynthesis